MAHTKSQHNSILRIPRDLDDDDRHYQPLPKDHFAVKDALEIMSNIADHIERLIGPREPYEINLLGLRNSTSLEIQPVLTIGIARSSRLESVLPNLDIPFIVHFSSHYPASFSNVADHRPLLDHHAGSQQTLPSIGSSCGLLNDERHSVTLGSYVRLGIAPKKICILTAPLNIDPSLVVPKGSIVTQPSMADRDVLYSSLDRDWRDVLKRDLEQTKAVTSLRKELNRTFEFARTIRSVSGLQPASRNNPMTEERILCDTVWDSQPTNRSLNQSLACPSDSWAILEVTRKTTVVAHSHFKRRWRFGRTILKQPENTHPFIPGLLVSKVGRTTGHTIGTVNGVRSLYRLPRDGVGVRRYDYPVLSYPWGGAFGLPGDAGAVVLEQQEHNLDDTQIQHRGKPCALIVASSTRGHVCFVQDMESVVKGVRRAGLGKMTFMEHAVQ